MPAKTPLPDVVSNTGPLISLERVGFAFIRQMYRKILVPQSVLQEISCDFPSGVEYLRHQGIEDLVTIVPDPQPHPLTSRLDADEKAAISLALSTGLRLLIEEREGRRIAAQLGLSFLESPDRSVGLIGWV